MSTKTNGEGVEGLTVGAETSSSLEKDRRGWPILHASNEPCDGTNPLTGRTCSRGYHQGYHRDLFGAEWLDD